MADQLLPRTLTPELLAAWIKKNSKEEYKHKIKYNFEKEEIDEKARQSSKHGSAIIDLKALESQIKEYVKKGMAEDKTTIVIELTPVTGVDALTAKRVELDTAVRLGYYEEQVEIYGIPDAETLEMRFFCADGTEVYDRNRPLSNKEQRDYIGLYMRQDGQGISRTGTNDGSPI